MFGVEYYVKYLKKKNENNSIIFLVIYHITRKWVLKISLIKKRF